jgi:phage-related tail protein
MKRISFLVIILTFSNFAPARAEDAATEERLNQLSGKIEDLIASQETQRKRLGELSKELESLREQQTRPTGSYASQEDLKRLGEAVKEIDRKRMDDYEKVHAELLKLGKTLAAPVAPRGHKSDLPATEKSGSEKSGTEKAAPSEKGFEYTIKSGDTILAIVQAYKEQNIKITEKQILAANPGLVPEKMKVGQKIWIPAPSQ